MLPEPYYNRDGITIYCGRCERVLPFLDPVDIVLTDPPYGIGETSKRQRSRKGQGVASQKNYGAYSWDLQQPAAWIVEQALAKGNHAIVWGGNYFGLPSSSCWLVWDKDNGKTDFADCELAWTNLDKAVRKFKWRWQGMIQENGGDKKEHKRHPTQKPLPLMRWCLGLVSDAETVLDPFAGSGTTLVAAKLEGRQAIGIEISEKYCEIAVERLRQRVLF
jgi:DNA modification methylase